MIELSCFNWVQLIKKAGLPSGANHIALYLSTFMNAEHNVAWPSQTRIAHETGLSRSTVVKWIDYLDANGWLVKSSREHPVMTAGGPQRQNEYIINIPLKVVRQMVNDAKGCTDTDERLSDDRQKGARQLHTNNKYNNNKNKGLPDWLDKDAWFEFEQHRTEVKKLLTPLAIKKNLSVLERHKDRQREIIDVSITNGWKGLFPPKGKPVKPETPYGAGAT